MTSIQLRKFAITAFSLTMISSGCGSGSSNTGTGGSSATGTGGAHSTGGTTGTGGSSTGGSTGTGGSATGGATGMGGSATGGATGTGGSATGTGGGGAGTTGTGGAQGGAGGGGGHGGAAAGGRGGSSTGGAGAGGGSAGGASGAMSLTSPDQPEGAKFGTMFTCAAMNGTFGSGVNPDLVWTNVPAGTMSFAITFIDTKLGANMATGQHWAAWDIPATVREFPKGTTTLTGALAGAKQTNKYLAPCPMGDDTYEFTLYALSSATLTVASGAEGTGTSNSAGVAKVLTALQGITPLATATLHGTSGAKGL